MHALNTHRAVMTYSVSIAAAAEKAEGGQGGEDRGICMSTGEALAQRVNCDGLAGGVSLRTQKPAAAKGWGNDMHAQAIFKVAHGMDTQSLHRSRTLPFRSWTAGGPLYSADLFGLARRSCFVGLCARGRVRFPLLSHFLCVVISTMLCLNPDRLDRDLCFDYYSLLDSVFPDCGSKRDARRACISRRRVIVIRETVASQKI
ncbi:hypothetical protein DFH11DRAFT_960548 [Phellopilus nigrolimitatus]|nr:hypothetical protein DFH11DRAFT_960548 [Phellopilus nigrolimitatus]